MILKHRDTEVVRFDWVEPFGVKNVELNESAAQFLPIAFRDLAQFKYRLCSTCPLFTSDKYGFLPAKFVTDKAGAQRDIRFADIFFFDAIVFNTDRHLGNFGFMVDNDSNELKGLAPIFDNGYSLFSQAICNPGHRGDEFKDLRLFVARKEPKLYEHWLDIPGGVTDEMIDRLKGLENFEFSPHPLFAMPDHRLEVSQYFLQKRIRKIIKYREKADKYLNVRRKDVTITETIPDKLLKKAEESKRLRDDLKATLKSFPRAKTEKLAILYKTTTRTIARHIKALQEAGELKRVGSRKTGYWQVIEKPIC